MPVNAVFMHAFFRKHPSPYLYPFIVSKCNISQINIVLSALVNGGDFRWVG